jgi:hypothetical protein
VTEGLSEVRLPVWAICLVYVGETFAKLVDGVPSKYLTVSLCLPRVDYAAAFVGLGIVKNSLSAPDVSSTENRMKKLVGQWVVLKKELRGACVGRLEHDEDTLEYKIVHFKKQLPNPNSMTQEQWRNYSPPQSLALKTVLRPQDLDKVQAAGREFNEERSVGKHQVKKILSQDSSSTVLGHLLECDFKETAVGESGCIFTVYGSKARIAEEWAESLFREREAYVQSILRPKGCKEYEGSFRCGVEGLRSRMSDDNGSIAIIEAGRSLADQLVEGKARHRIILVGRNTPSYNESASLIMGDFDSRSEDCLAFADFTSKSIHCLSYYHQ